jgi:hypothetical protein
MKRASPPPTGKRRTLKPYDLLNKKQQAARRSYLKNRKPLLRDAPDFRVMTNVEKTRRYRERNPDQVKESSRRSYRKNPNAHRMRREKNWPRSYFGLTRRNAERNAKAKNVPFSITTKYLNELYDSQCCVCALSGLPFKRSPGGGPTIFSPSLDRIKPALGYVPGNVRFLLHGLNALKSDGTDDDVRFIIKSVYDRII